MAVDITVERRYNKEQREWQNLFPIMSMCHDWPVQNDESVRGPEKGCWCYFADFSNRG